MLTVAGVTSLVVGVSIIGVLQEPLKSSAYKLMSLISFRMLAKGFTAAIAIHNREFRPKKGDVCVANHTSPVDIILLSCDNCYALSGIDCWQGSI